LRTIDVSEPVKNEQSTGTPALGISAAIAGWAIPGLGHLLLRQWGKAVVYFLCVGGLACAGLAMRGGVFGGNPADLFDRLGFFADLGTGGLYFFAHIIQSAGPDIAHASGDYGTRMFATAGMLNLLTVLEAYEIGRGRKI
jgi:predicted membrane channel-forming protein YqfA (hemolysin III family)